MWRAIVIIACIALHPIDVLAAGQGDKPQKTIAEKIAGIAARIIVDAAKGGVAGTLVSELLSIQTEVNSVEQEYSKLKCKNISTSLSAVGLSIVNMNQVFIFGDEFDIHVKVKNNTDYYLELDGVNSKLTIPSEVFKNTSGNKTISPRNIDGNTAILAPGGEFTAVWSGKLDKGNDFFDEIYNAITFRSGYYDFPLNVLFKVQDSGVCSNGNNIESYRNINSSHMVRLSNTFIVVSSIFGGVIAFLVYHAFAAYIVVRKPYNLVNGYSERLRINEDFKFSFISIFIVPSIVTIAILSTYGVNYGFNIEITDFYGAIFVGFIAEFIALKWRGYYLQRFENNEREL